jgi:hypothetical protein
MQDPTPLLRRKAAQPQRAPPDREPIIELESDAGENKIVPELAGARGYDDLRYRAMRARLGEDLRPELAGAGELVRMPTPRRGNLSHP